MLIGWRCQLMPSDQIFAGLPGARWRWAATGLGLVVGLGQGGAVGIIQMDKNMMGWQQALLDLPIKRQVILARTGL